MPYPDSGTRCPIEGCRRNRDVGQLLCALCWKRVPQILKDRVNRTWRKRLKGAETLGIDEAYRLAAAEHEAAKRDAIECLEHA
jgi:hypothetical protein